MVRRDKDVSTTAAEVARMLESRTRVAALNSTLQLLNIVYAYNKLGKNVISVGMGVHPIHITIPTKGGVKEKTGEYDYYLDIPHDTITAALTPQLIFKPDDAIFIIKFNK